MSTGTSSSTQKPCAVSETALFEVIPGHLFVSNWKSATDSRLLAKHGIRHVINMTDGEKHGDTNEEEEEQKQGEEVKQEKCCTNEISSVIHWQFPLTEEDYPEQERLKPEEILSHWQQAATVISGAICDKNEPVLVHCVEGVNRSVATICYYLMHAHSSRLSFDEACALLRSTNPRSSMDHSFISLLSSGTLS